MLAPLRRFSLQPKGFFRRTRGRIYVAFGEHPAAGVCVCVCSSQLVVFLLGCLFVCLFVRLFVCVFVWLFVHLYLSLFLWLVGCLCLCVLVCFLPLCSTISCLSNLSGDLFVFFSLWWTLGPHCNTWGSILTPLVYMCCFFCYLGGP